MKPKSLEIFIPGPAGRLEAKYYTLAEQFYCSLFHHIVGVGVKQLQQEIQILDFYNILLLVFLPVQE